MLHCIAWCRLFSLESACCSIHRDRQYIIEKRMNSIISITFMLLLFHLYIYWTLLTAVVVNQALRPKLGPRIGPTISSGRTKEKTMGPP